MSDVYGGTPFRNAAFTKNPEALVSDKDILQVDANLQDQTTPTVILPFNQVHDSTTLAAEALINQRIITVVDATGIVAPVGIVKGSFIILFSPSSERFMFAHVTTVVGTTITLDTPLDFTFPIGSFVDVAITDMSVNGLVTPQAFGLRGTGAPPGVDITVDITRIIFTCITDGAVTLAKFGDLTALLNGLVLRRRDGTNRNIFNIKSNREIAGLTFDFSVSSASNPQQGENGFVSRLTFASQGKIGVAIRLPIGEDLEFINQDDLTDIILLEVIAEGHIVED